VKRGTLKVYRKLVTPLRLMPQSPRPAELVKITETPLTKAEYDQMLTARSSTDTPVQSLSVPNVEELHFQLSLYAYGVTDEREARGVVLVRRGGWKTQRDGQLSIKCRYVPLAGNENCFSAAVAKLVKRYDWSRELIVCAPAKDGAGRCLLTTGLQQASYPELIYRRVLSDATDESYDPGDVLFVQGEPPGEGTYVCLARNGDMVRLRELRVGKKERILGCTSRVVDVNVRHREITPLDTRLDINDLPA
jgi:hypothetical protein